MSPTAGPLSPHTDHYLLDPSVLDQEIHHVLWDVHELLDPPPVDEHALNEWRKVRYDAALRMLTARAEAIQAEIAAVKKAKALLKG
jgi:hypothetical protein